jgi:hypothetical protein
VIKLLTVLNILAGGASIAGFILTFRRGDFDFTLGSIFAFTLALVFYVLFVPGNRLERNVRAKVELYDPIGDWENLIIQRGEIEIETDGSSTSVEFYEPFAEPPKVELIFIKGNQQLKSEIALVTNHQFVLGHSVNRWPKEKAFYKWVASGFPLKKRSV